PLKADARDRFRIVEDVLAHHNAIEVFCREWERSGKRLRLAAMIGDWLAAEDAACLSSDANLKRMVSERAAKCRALRYAGLALPQFEEMAQADALLEMVDSAAPALEARLEKALNGPVSAATLRAVEIIDRRNDPHSCPVVARLLRRLDPEKAAPHP